MNSISEIKSRIKNISETRKITNAMYLISSTKLRKAKLAHDRTDPYFRRLREEAKRIFRSMKEVDSKYLYPVDMSTFVNGTYGILVITADRGLAGAYNANVLKETFTLLNEHEDCRLFVVGDYGREYFRRHNIPIEEDFFFSPKDPTLEEARKIASHLLGKYESGELKKIFVVYTDFTGVEAGDALSLRILPFHRTYFTPEKSLEEEVIKHAFIFSPSPKAVLENVMESTITGIIYGALVDSYCCEHNARMNAMSSATRNADELLSDLSVEYNRMRQQIITREITEISAGAKAQRQKRSERRKKEMDV